MTLRFGVIVALFFVSVNSGFSVIGSLFFIELTRHSTPVALTSQVLHGESCQLRRKKVKSFENVLYGQVLLTIMTVSILRDRNCSTWMLRWLWRKVLVYFDGGYMYVCMCVCVWLGLMVVIKRVPIVFWETVVKIWQNVSISQNTLKNTVCDYGHDFHLFPPCFSKSPWFSPFLRPAAQRVNGQFSFKPQS